MRKVITKKEIKELQSNNAHVMLVDIRSSVEYEKQHVPSTTNIPTEELQNQIQSFSNNGVIVCICNHGKERSQQAAETLYSKGFENTFYLEGGTAEWLALK